MKTIVLARGVGSRVRAVDHEITIDFVWGWDEDWLSIYPVELQIGLVQRREVRARLELLERKGTLYPDLGGTRGACLGAC